MIYRVIHEPRYGAIFLEEGRWLYPFNSTYDEASQVRRAKTDWVIHHEWETTVLADTDSGCDRTCTHTEYTEPDFHSAVFEDGTLLGFYYVLQDYYHHRELTAVPHLFLLDRQETLRIKAGGHDEFWELIRREPGKKYQNSQHIW